MAVVAVPPNLLILPYTAVSVSIVARLIFMYLLYTKHSTNIYSLSFCYLSIISSSLWIPYGVVVDDFPIIIRSGVEILLLSTSALYILRNRCYRDRKKDHSPMAPSAVTAATAMVVSVVEAPKSAKESPDGNEGNEGNEGACNCVQSAYLEPAAAAGIAAGSVAGHPAGTGDI